MPTLAKPPANTDAASRYCTFYLGDLFFGLDVLEVREVMLYQEMTSVPLTSSVMSGLINLRGETVTAIDLRKRLELPDYQSKEEQKNIIISAEGGTVSLQVDEIGDVITPDPGSFEAPPETLKGMARQLVTGVYKLEDNIMLVLDIDKTVDIDAAECALPDA